MRITYLKTIALVAWIAAAIGIGAYVWSAVDHPMGFVAYAGLSLGATIFIGLELIGGRGSGGEDHDEGFGSGESSDGRPRMMNPSTRQMMDRHGFDESGHIW